MSMLIKLNQFFSFLHLVATSSDGTTNIMNVTSVADPPSVADDTSITKAPTNKTVVELEGVNFTCDAMGSPRPNIIWFICRDGMLMQISSGTSFTIFNSSNGDAQVTSTLMLTRVKPYLAGVYICNASNVVSYDTESATLVVHSKYNRENITYLKCIIIFVCILKAVPSIVFPEDGLMIKVNQYDVAELVCSAIGIPQPLIDWLMFNDNKNITLITNDSVTISEHVQLNYSLSNGRGLVLAVSSTLIISETLDGDSGRYYCFANSTQGSDSQEIDLEIQGKRL